MSTVHTTNYANTFIAAADDCQVHTGVVPPQKTPATIARLHYDLISAAPYGHSSDEVIFMTHAVKQGIPEDELDEAREQFFSKGQPCLRSSPLGKNYGWGIHSDAEGRVAIYAAGSPDYQKFLTDPTVTQLKAMRSQR